MYLPLFSSLILSAFSAKIFGLLGFLSSVAGRHGRKEIGKIQRGAHKRGLKPQIFRENRGKSFPENRAFSGQIGAISGLVGPFSGPIGTNSSAPHSHGGRAEIAPKGPFLARLALFGLSPPLLSPRLDFQEETLLVRDAFSPELLSSLQSLRLGAFNSGSFEQEVKQPRGNDIALESLNGGFANGGLRCLPTIVHDCLRLSSFCDESSP